MRRILRWAFVSVLLFLLVPLCAQAVESKLAVRYGEWSAWQTEPIADTSEIEVQKEYRNDPVYTYTWEYDRYVYYNSEAQAWFSAYAEQSGEHVRAESGRWEKRVSEEPLGVSGYDGTETVFDGGWYHEKAVTDSEDRYRTMYRYRTVATVTCEISASEILLLPGKKRRLTVRIPDYQGGFAWESDNPEVATVDDGGMVTARSVGIANILISSQDGQVASCEVLVCQQRASIPDGVYTLRLGTTGMALTLGKYQSKTRYRLGVSEYIIADVQRFVLNNVGTNTFTLNPVENKSLFVDIKRGTDMPEIGDIVQAHRTSDRTAQYWRAVFVPDGSYIIYPRYNPSCVLGAVPLEAGRGVRLEALGKLETIDRWILVPSGKSEYSALYTYPVIRNALSSVATDFGENNQDYMTITANGRRVYAVSMENGTVIDVDDTCTHDLIKMPDAQGKLHDPCGEMSLGKTITIEHNSGQVTVYGYLSQIYVEKGDYLRKGQLIGKLGATGVTDRVQLYFKMLKKGVAVDPRGLIKFPAKGNAIK